MYWLLILVAGWYGAYTFALRGGVFCNAQTANVVLFAMALGNGKRLSAAYTNCCSVDCHSMRGFNCLAIGISY